jgi:MSHA pilin protein MshC
MRRQAGFTIIELVAIIVLIGIISAVAYPRMAVDGFDETGYRDQVMASLAFARKAAVAQRRYVQVTLTGNALSFRIANSTPESLSGTTFAGAAGRDLILPGSDSAQIAPRGRTGLAGPITLVFSPLGIATSTSYLYTVTGSAVRTLRVDEMTGYVY